MEYGTTAEHVFTVPSSATRAEITATVFSSHALSTVVCTSARERASERQSRAVSSVNVLCAGCWRLPEMADKMAEATGLSSRGKGSMC